MMPARLNRILRIVLILLILLLTGGGVTGDTSTPADEPSSPPAGTLIMVYMIGSDLESGEGAGTADLMEIVDGYTGASPHDLQIVVAYGGSTTPGWNGIRIATVENLTKDAENGIFGDEGYEISRNEGANMASAETLASFLADVSAWYPADRVMLIFWDHGMAYDGFGLDEETGDELSLDDLDQALGEGSLPISMIGFDACLMGSLEVAAVLSPYSEYLVASTELEPGGGWRYDRWVQELAADPTMDTETIGKTIADTYMETEESGKTLSVIRLSAIPALLEALDKVGSGLNPALVSPEGFYTLGRAFGGTTRFGVEPGTSDTDTTMDLGIFAQNVRETMPDLADPIANLLDRIAETVVYERHDAFIPETLGISILSPTALSWEDYTGKQAVLSLTPGWDTFFASYLTRTGDDLEKPALSATETGTYEIDDPYNAADVYADYYLVDEAGVLLLGSDPVFPDDEGYYEIPEWDGRWMYLTDPDDPDQYALMEFYFETILPDGTYKYSTEIDIERNGSVKEAVMYTYLTPESGEMTISITPYTVRPDGETIFARSSMMPEPGDIITTYAMQYTDEMEETEMTPIGSITITEGTELMYDLLPDGTYAIGLSTGYAPGEESYSDFGIYTLSDGILTPERIEDDEETGFIPESGDLEENNSGDVSP